MKILICRDCNTLLDPNEVELDLVLMLRLTFLRDQHALCRTNTLARERIS